MISLKDALDLVLTHTTTITETEKISLIDAFGRTLAEEVVADTDLPPFDKSAMDGYACKQEDLPGPFTLTSSLAAGTLMTEQLKPGQCVQIFTGARVPKGADCVIMQESTGIDENGRITITSPQNKTNICYQGEDVHEGQVIAHTGAKLTAPDLAILASAGHVSPRVYRQPVVGIICTGNEIIEAHHHPEGAKIRNTNIYQLWAQVTSQGAIPRYYGIVPDDVEQLLFYCKKALSECDMLITTGGASVGLYDLIPFIYTEMGATIHFSGVSMQPGKPVVFATLDGNALWGLSGNPVSSLLQYQLLASYSLAVTSGTKIKPRRATHLLSTDLVRHKKNRDLFVPVNLADNGMVYPVSFNGSAHITALHGIYGFACMPADCNRIDKGQLVDCILL